MNMKQATPLDEAAGKTIAGVLLDSSNVLIAFTDGTYSLLVLQAAGDDSYIEEGGRPRYRAFADADLIRLGITTQADIDEHEAARRSLQERAERARYEVLKAKYETPEK